MITEKIKETILVVSLNIFEPENDKVMLRGRFSDSINTYKYMWSFLEPLFAKVVFYDYSNNIGQANGFAKVNNDIIKLVETEKPKFVLYYGMDENRLAKETYERVRELGAQTIGMFVDDETSFDASSKLMIPYMDFIFTFDSETSVEKYRKHGAKAVFLPSGASTAKFHKLENKKYLYDVSFVGVKKYDREKAVEYIESQGIHVETFGSGWANGYVPDGEINNIYNSSRINLNFTKSLHEKQKHFKWRTVEVPLSGGFLLTEDIPGLEKHFDVEKEISVFYSLGECCEKIKYFLAHEEEREEIAKNGWERAMAEYTWEAKFRQMFELILYSEDVRNTKHDNLRLENIDYNRRLGRKLIYAMCFYMELGRCEQVENYLNQIDSLDFSDPRVKVVSCVIRHFPESVGKKIIRMCYKAYYGNRG